ncbi:MAG: hypothetical protein PGN16_07735 [Sphingomonas phyllosphaerae]
MRVFGGIPAVEGPFAAAIDTVPPSHDAIRGAIGPHRAANDDFSARKHE